MIDFFYNWVKEKISLQTVEWQVSNGIRIFYLFYLFIFSGTPLITPGQGLLDGPYDIRIFNDIYTFEIDGTEQCISFSNDVFKDTMFYSSKKGYATINILLVVGINSSKKTFFISVTLSLVISMIRKQYILQEKCGMINLQRTNGNLVILFFPI